LEKPQPNFQYSQGGFVRQSFNLSALIWPPKKPETLPIPPKSIATLEAEDFVNRGARGSAESIALFRTLLSDQWDTVTREALRYLMMPHLH
jgi:hypothetical protein